MGAVLALALTAVDGRAASFVVERGSVRIVQPASIAGAFDSAIGDVSAVPAGGGLGGGGAAGWARPPLPLACWQWQRPPQPCRSCFSLSTGSVPPALPILSGVPLPAPLLPGLALPLPRQPCHFVHCAVWSAPVRWHPVWISHPPPRQRPGLQRVWAAAAHDWHPAHSPAGGPRR